MSLETDLQNAISSATQLNQNVQGKIDEINTELDAAVADSQSRTSSSINSLTSAVNAELGNLRPYSMSMLFWKDLGPDEIIRIHPAMVIGQGWDDGGMNHYSQYGTGNDVVWDNDSGAYRPIDENCVNPFIAYGEKYGVQVADEYDWTNENSPGYGYNIGTPNSPVIKDPVTGENLSFVDADGNTQYYKCYHDFWTNDTLTRTSRDILPVGDLTSISNRKAYLVMQGSVVGHPDRSARTFVNVGMRTIGSHSQQYAYTRQDSNGDGTNNVTAFNWARRRMARHNGASQTNSHGCGNPAVGDAPHTTGLTCVQGQHYGFSTAYRNFSNITTRELELEYESGAPTTVPEPNTTTRWNNYSAKWAIPIGDMPYRSTPELRLYNWGYTGLMIEGWGIAIMSPVER